MEFLNNKWLKRGISFATSIYGVFIAWLAYVAVFYDVTITNLPLFYILNVLVNSFFFLLMFYTRKQPFTCFVTMILMVLMFPVIFFNLDCIGLFVPSALVVITMFFVCRMNETAKTVLGTVFLLMYILGGLALFIATNLFYPKTVDTLLQQGVSDSGQYRYYVVDVQDKSIGRTEVYVEPNDKDIDLGFITFNATGYEQRKYNARNHEEPDVEWKDDILYINGERYDITEFKWKFKL